MTGAVTMRARGFVVSRGTGEPAAGVRVIARFRRNGSTTTLAMLSSDDAGYVSFELPEAPGREVWLEAVGDPTSRSALFGQDTKEVEEAQAVNEITNLGVAVLRVDAPERPDRTLPSVQGLPDARDYELSPESFLIPRRMALGEDQCTIPVRSDMPVHTVRFTQIVRRSTLGPTGDGGGMSTHGELSLSPMLDPFEFNTADVVLQVLPCDILEYEQQWSDLGEALGTILYSLPLAPCESVNIAVIEASRDDETARSDSVVAGEHLEHSLFRDRGITESVKGALKESQGGSSFMAGHGGAYSGSFPIGNFGATHAIGYATSQSWGERKLQARSAQDLHDSTIQSSDLVRSLNSTVIVHGTQAERHQLQTRTVTNHNHCHAMTVQYYEVLRRLRLRTRFMRSRPGVLVPYRGLQFKAPTPQVTWIPDLVKYWSITDPERSDLHLANRLRPLLLDSLLEPRLRENFDSVRRLLFFDGTLPPELLPGAKGDYLVERIRVMARRGQYGTDVNAVSFSMPSVNFAEPLERFQNRYDQPILRDQAWWGDDPAYDEDPREIGPFRFTLATPELRSKLKEVRIHWSPGGDDLTLKGLTVTTERPDGTEDVLVNESVNRRFTTDSTEPRYERFAIKQLPPAPASDEPSVAAYQRRTRDVALAWELITHLHDHRDRYAQLLVAAKDPSWFAHALDHAFGSAGPVRDSIDSVPVAICGRHLVFPFNGPERPQPAGLDAPVVAEPEASVVSLPTRGVFAEAQLSTCNACEKRDVTRFWRWEESPCDKPPQIEGISPGFHGEAPDVKPSQLPSAVVQITQPPAAPDPVGLVAAMQLLGKGDAFRDMSGQPELSSLLSGLASGAVDLAQARGLAKAAQSKMAAGSGSGQNSGGTSQSPAERYDNLQVAREVADQANRMGWSPETTERVTSGIVGGIDYVSGTGSSGPLPHPSLADTADRLAADLVTMNSYRHFQGAGNGDGIDPVWNWFLSRNDKLAGSAHRPTAFASWSDWTALTWQGRQVVADIAGLTPADLAALVQDAPTLAKLKTGYGRWPASTYAVFQHPPPNSAEDANTCNIFVGEALHRSGLSKMRNGKYYNAAEIYSGNPPFFEVDKGQVRRGDIAAWGGVHVEIVTSLTRGTFCSRGGYRKPIGAIKCNDPTISDRTVADAAIRFMRVWREGFQI